MKREWRTMLTQLTIIVSNGKDNLNDNYDDNEPDGFLDFADALGFF